MILKRFGFYALHLVLCFGFYIEWVLKKEPCSLCFLQRFAVLGIACCLYLGAVFKKHVVYTAIGILFALFGLAVSLRHMALNICIEASSESFYFWGYRMYTWTFLIFFLSLIGLACLLFYQKQRVVKSIEEKIMAATLLLFTTLCTGSVLLK